MNICVRCEHFCEGAGAIWYDMFCSAPAVQRIKTVDPVTGKSRFLVSNDIGNTIYTNERRPSPRDINTDGACKYYVDKKS